MEINEAKNIGQSVIDIHQAILDFHGLFDTDDEVTVDKDGIRIVLRSVSEIVDVVVNAPMTRETTAHDLLETIRRGFTVPDSSVCRDASITAALPNGWVGEGRWKHSRSEISEHMYEGAMEDSKIFAATRDALTDANVMIALALKGRI